MPNKYIYNLIVKITFLFFLFLFNISLSAQFISLSDTINICLSDTAILVASEANISSSLINVDDIHSEIIPIGFDFDFYGNTYNECVISANGLLPLICHKKVYTLIGLLITPYLTQITCRKML